MEKSSDHHSIYQHGVKGSEVFVGGLARNITESRIHELFATCGEIVEIRLIKDQAGNSKGYCFVRFARKESVDKAVQEKSGVMLEGRKIGVIPSNDQSTLFLGNLCKDWSANDFDKMVRQVFQDIISVDLAMPLGGGDVLSGQKRQNRGFAFVKFSCHAAAARAYRTGSKSDFLLGGYWHPLVEWAHEEPDVNPEELSKIKIAFVRNLPTDADEGYLSKLFEPFGKLEKVVLSRKNRSPVGFVHFADRADLDNALEEMNEKTVRGPTGSSIFKLQVEVARPFEKKKKRSCNEFESNLATKTLIHSAISIDEHRDGTLDSPKIKAARVKYLMEEPVVADTYETAVVSLPVAVKERLLRILRLNIATRFDVDIHCITGLKELRESAAISVLDQFMLSGADKVDKGAYLAGLISRHQVDKLGLSRNPMHLSRLEDIPSFRSSVTSEVPRLFGGVHLPAVDSLTSRFPARDSGASGLSVALPRYESYTSRYSPSILDYPSTHQPIYGKLEEKSPSPSVRMPVSFTDYSKTGLESHFTPAANRQPSSRPQIRFDPFTGEPYKFDPFTGEPILPESESRSRRF